MLKQEFDIFLTSLMFYTRLPVPKRLEYSDELLNKATRYFPLVGILIGLLVGGVYKLFSTILPFDIAIILSMAAGIIATGAFHEDGFADVCDGFGGGYTKEQRLNIMKDSRIGTYGTIALIFILLIKFLLLRNIGDKTIFIGLILGHGFSRFFPVVLIRYSKYSRLDELSKVKPIGKRISIGGFLVALLFAFVPMLLFLNPGIFLIIPLPLVISLILMKYFEKRIDGYTGDCLGSIQQVCEISIYISLLVLQKYVGLCN